MENDICSQEHAIAKKHHLLGRFVNLPNCSSLPKTDCFELGIEKPEVDEGKKKILCKLLSINTLYEFILVFQMKSVTGD